MAVATSGALAMPPTAQPLPSDGEHLDAGPAAGAARATLVSAIRQGYTVFFRTLGIMAAKPHKWFRPENPSLGRFEDAMDGIRQSSASQKAHLEGTFQSRGAYWLLTTFGFRTAMKLKLRSVAANSIMGTVLFGTYDVVRALYITPDQRVPHLSQTALAAGIAGGVHGMCCAPVEVAALRLQAAEHLGRRSAPHVWEALKRPLPVTIPEEAASAQSWFGRLRARYRILSGALLPLSVVRDGLGICAFFVTFEGTQVYLHRAWEERCRNLQLDTEGDGEKERRRIISGGKICGTLLAGGSAGMAYRIVSWPYDNLIVRVTQRCEAGGALPDLGKQCRLMYQEYGLRSTLFPSCRMVISAFPASALGLLVYEYLR